MLFLTIKVFPNSLVGVEPVHTNPLESDQYGLLSLEEVHDEVADVLCGSSDPLTCILGCTSNCLTGILRRVDDGLTSISCHVAEVLHGSIPATHISDVLAEDSTANGSASQSHNSCATCSNLCAGAPASTCFLLSFCSRGCC